MPSEPIRWSESLLPVGAKIEIHSSSPTSHPTVWLTKWPIPRSRFGDFPAFAPIVVRLDFLGVTFHGQVRSTAESFHDSRVFEAYGTLEAE